MATRLSFGCTSLDHVKDHLLLPYRVLNKAQLGKQAWWHLFGEAGRYSPTGPGIVGEHALSSGVASPCRRASGGTTRARVPLGFPEAR